MNRVTTRPRRLGRPPAASRAETRARLLDAATRIFAERGYAGATLADVAREADVTAAAIYHYWASKADLYAAVGNVAAGIFRDTFDQHIRPGMSLRERVTAGIEAIADVMVEHPHIASLAPDVQALWYPDVQRYFLEHVPNIVDHFHEVIADRGAAANDPRLVPLLRIFELGLARLAVIAGSAGEIRAAATALQDLVNGNVDLDAEEATQ